MDKKQGKTRRVLGLLALISILFACPAFAANTCGDTNNVCTIDSNISSDTTWIDGNTYVILGDVNVSGSGVDLTIQPGAVVKYIGNVELAAMNGGRIVANGTADKNIIFTSCKDQNAYTGSTNANTSTVSGCSGAPAGRDYNTAIWIRSDAGNTSSDSFSYLRMYDANIAIRLDTNIGSIHDTNISSPQSAVTAIQITTTTSDLNIYNIYMQNYSSGITMNSFNGDIHHNRFTSISNGVIPTTFTGRICDNNFSNGIIFLSFGTNTAGTFSGTYCNNTTSTTTTGDGIFFNFVVSACSGSIYGNTFYVGPSGVGIYTRLTACVGMTTSIYNNLFIRTSTSASGIFFEGGNKSPKIYNNTFFNFDSGRYAIQNAGNFSGNIQRNLFAYVAGTALKDINSTATVSNNAYYNVGTIGAVNGQTNGDQNSDTGFTTDPFLNDGSDRNFLLNTTSTGGAKLVGAGGVDSNGVDINNFFNLRTTQLSNKLDTQTIDIGYHYDQNAPYVQVLSPSDSNTLAGTQLIDFNVESGYGVASALTARLAYATTAQTSTTGGTQIVSQSLSSYSCSAGPVFRCSYAWDTTTLTDANYFIALTATDSNGSRIDNSDNNFLIANSSTTGPTSGIRYACGNNVCDGNENSATCPLDCDSVCGDKACTHIENPNTCPIDCAIGCGNQTCESTESSATCPVDCGYTYDDENPNTPPIDIIPEIDPNTGTPKQCTKNSDCEDDNLCTANRCIKSTCYAVYYPDGEPCDIGSICQNHACIRITKPFTPPTQTDPVFIVSVVIILLVLGTIAFEYFKK